MAFWTAVLFSTESIEERFNGSHANNQTTHFLFKNVPLSSLYLVQEAQIEADLNLSKWIPWACLEGVTNQNNHTIEIQSTCYSTGYSMYLVKKLRELPHRISGILQLNFLMRHPVSHSIKNVELVIKYPGNYFCFLFQPCRTISVAIISVVFFQ